MKRLFDKVYFSSELLSDKVLVGGNTQNLLKFLIADTISATEVLSIELKVEAPSDSREGEPTSIIDWTTLTQDSDNKDIYSVELIINSTEAYETIQGVIKITDINNNVYYNHYDSFSIKVL